MDAIDVFEDSRKSVKSAQDSRGICFYAPGKAANCGGVAVSGLEMAQNSQRLMWTSEEVDAKLKDIMVSCCESCFAILNAIILPYYGMLMMAYVHGADAQTKHAGRLARSSQTEPSHPSWPEPTLPVSLRWPTR